METTITSKRLILRPWSIDDAGELYNLASVKEIGLNAGWLPHTNINNSKEIIKMCLLKDLTFAITLNNKIIGCISIMKKEYSNLEFIKDNEAEIGFWIGKEYQNNGYGLEAIETILDYSFNTLNLENIYAAYFEGNNSSKRVQEKAKFEFLLKKENVYWSPLSVYKNIYINVLSKKDWLICH